ncbi:MAG: hypothetical protein FJX47_08620 [Alphaproteobacteria bacterium]|nr:hypothetical protein [Alphaproteobacteria bacterium]
MPIPTIMLVGAVLHLVVLILLAWPATVLAVPLWMALGFLGNISALAFTVLGQHFPPGLAGRATTGLNLFLFVATFTMQSAVGWVLDRFPATATGYAPEGYGVAFFGLAAIQLCGIAWFLGYGRWFSRS